MLRNYRVVSGTGRALREIYSASLGRKSEADKCSANRNQPHDVVPGIRFRHKMDRKDVARGS